MSPHNNSMPHNCKPNYLILNKTDVRQNRDDLLIEIFTTYLVIQYTICHCLMQDCLLQKRMTTRSSSPQGQY